jgi:hypothetical protein
VTYYDQKGQFLFRWPKDGHVWVLVNEELIDGNSDILFENPKVPQQVAAHSYWGLKTQTPRDRKYTKRFGTIDKTVSRIRLRER